MAVAEMYDAETGRYGYEAIVAEELDEEEEKWAKHYSSFHQILLVGEGDFSFSLSLALSFGSASNMIATSLDSYDDVIKKYRMAKSNLVKLLMLGASILHGVDATKMKLHTDLQMRKFDRIIFNFPHAGFHGKEDGFHLIKMHRSLVHGFFRNVSGMLRADGEIHVNHKTTAPFCHWNLEDLACRCSLVLTERVEFKIEDYPGYNNKRGAGLRCDEPFPLGECSTFKFRLSPASMKMPPANWNVNLVHRRHQKLRVNSEFKFEQPISFTASHQMAQLNRNLDSPLWRPQQLQVSPQHIVEQPNLIAPVHLLPNLCLNSPKGYDVGGPAYASRIFSEYFKDILKTFGRTDYDVRSTVREALCTGFDRYMSDESGKTLTGYIEVLEELHRLCRLRSSRLQRMLLACDGQF